LPIIQAGQLRFAIADIRFHAIDTIRHCRLMPPDIAAIIFHATILLRQPPPPAFISHFAIASRLNIFFSHFI
jgi:hypothetical protein